MKKVAFGISLILFGIALFLLGDFGHFSIADNDFAESVYLILPFAGVGMSVWGLFDKGD